jgi:hypothetical protein
MLRLRKSWHAVFVRLRAREYETTMRQKSTRPLARIFIGLVSLRFHKNSMLRGVVNVEVCEGAGIGGGAAQPGPDVEGDVQTSERERCVVFLGAVEKTAENKQNTFRILVIFFLAGKNRKIKNDNKNKTRIKLRILCFDEARVSM